MHDFVACMRQCFVPFFEPSKYGSEPPAPSASPQFFPLSLRKMVGRA